MHVFGVGPYETPALPGLSDYLPALLTLGALLAALIYFGAAARGDRADANARLLAGIAGAVMLQLSFEVSRVFVAYPYPWHVGRVAAIALIAGITAVLATAYAARRFAPGWRTGMLAAVSAAVVAALILVPWYDVKAMAAIMAAALALIAAGSRGLADRRPGSGGAVAGGIITIALMAWQLTVFLDQSYYLVAAGLLVVLVVEQVSLLRAARLRRDQETARAEALEERLRQAMETGETIVGIKDGTRLHQVPESDILFLRAADDYCDVALVEGREFLATMTLARLLERLPAGFVRVHKSFAVNRRHISKVMPRPGGGRQLRLSDGTTVPIGRSYADAVAGFCET